MLENELSREEQLLLLDALGLAIDACEWTKGEKATEFMDLYQKLGACFLTDFNDEDDDNEDEDYLYRGD